MSNRVNQCHLIANMQFIGKLNKKRFNLSAGKHGIVFVAFKIASVATCISKLLVTYQLQAHGAITTKQIKELKASFCHCY